MASGQRWTRDELLVMMNVYEKLPFGQFDEGNRVIQDIADRLGRTPGAVAMKLSNLASLDPAIHARGRKGLKGASNLDRAVWAEFQSNRDSLAPESETLFQTLFKARSLDTVELVKGVGVRRIRGRAASSPSSTEALSTVKARRGQDFFRQAVLNNFDGCCGITGIPVRRLLVASHIIPWSDSVATRLDVRNGLCLSTIHDAAFDGGLITFDNDLRLVLGRLLRDAMTLTALKDNFLRYDGQRLRLPPNAVPPDKKFIETHRTSIFERI